MENSTMRETGRESGLRVPLEDAMAEVRDLEARLGAAHRLLAEQAAALGAAHAALTEMLRFLPLGILPRARQHAEAATALIEGRAAGSLTTDPVTRLLVLPCPFCGSPASVEASSSGAEAVFVVGCDSDGEPECPVGQSLTTYARRGDAVAAWNRRAPLPGGTTVIPVTRGKGGTS
jgi:hypothetical protein